MKRIILLMLVISVIFSFAACGNDESVSSSQKNDSTEESTNNSAEESTNNSAEDNESENNNVVMLPQELINEAKYIAESPKGYAVVYHDNVYYCTDGLGNVLGSLEEGEPYAKPSPSGYIMVDLGDELGVVDKTGKLLFTESTLGVDGFSMPERQSDVLWYEYVIPSFEDDYLPAYKVEETYDSVTYSIGILGLDGKWASPLSSEHPILKTSTKWSETKLKRSIAYIGDDIFAAYNYIEKLSLYNLSNNKTYLVDLEVGLTAPEETDFKFYNGKIIWENIYSHETHYYSVDTNGNVEKFFVGNGSGSILKHSESAVINDEYFWIDDELWDRKTTAKISEKDYNCYFDAKYPNGYEPVIIENSAGTSYFSVKNTDGYKFEPIKLDFDTYNSSFEIDKDYVMIEIWSAGTTGYIYDYNGKFINKIKSTMYGSLSIKNGIVRHYHKNEGATYFLPTDTIKFD